MSDILSITDAGALRGIIATGERVVVKFTAPSWCRPCIQFAPVYKAVADLVEDVTFVSVDIDDADWATSDYGVQSVPTVVLFEGGERVRDLKERTAIRFKNELS